MDTLDYIVEKFNLKNKLSQRYMPIEIPNYGRNNLGELFKELGFKVGVEVGTKRGQYAEELCKDHPDFKLFCIDPYKSYSDYNRIDTATNEVYMKEAAELLKPYNVEFIRKYSMDAVKDFDDGSLDFVYIDGNHQFKYVTEDVYEWSKKVRVGGVISGHDYAQVTPYKPHKLTHVWEAIQGYTRAYDINPWFVLGNRLAPPEDIRDKPRSWMWVKQYDGAC